MANQFDFHGCSKIYSILNYRESKLMFDMSEEVCRRLYLSNTPTPNATQMARALKWMGSLHSVHGNAILGGKRRY